MTKLKSLTSILPLAIILLGLISYNFMSAAWAPAPPSPPNSNVAAPINVGASALSFQVGRGQLTFDRVNALTEMRSPKYCDLSGQNCKTVAEMGGGGSAVTNSYTKTALSRGNNADAGPYLYVETGSTCTYPNPATNACSCPADYTASISGSTMGTGAYNPGDGDYRTVVAATQTTTCTPSGGVTGKTGSYITAIGNISGVTVPAPPAGVSSWPDYLICEANVIVGGKWKYVIVPLIHFNNTTKEFAYLSGIGNITFNQAGNVVESNSLHATCSPVAANLSGLCSAGLCGYN